MTKCTKNKYRSIESAQQALLELEEKYGYAFEVYPCQQKRHRGFFHVRSKGKRNRYLKVRQKRDGVFNVGNPRSRQLKDRRYQYRKKRLPIEVWEGEGGAVIDDC